MKDPRTGDTYNLDDSIRNIFHRVMSQDKLQEMLVKRMSGLTNEESTLYVLSHYYIVTVDEFVSNVNLLVVEQWK